MLSPSQWRRTSTELLVAIGSGPIIYWIARQWLLRPWPGGDASAFVLNWWAGLCALAVVNLGLLLVSIRAFDFRMQDQTRPYSRRWHLILASVYVLGCAQRSVWPKVDVQRFVLSNSWLSSIAVGRTIATVAELCFAAQWALLLWEYSNDARFRFGRIVAWMIVPLLALAQACCWYSVLTTSFAGHALEESLWAFSAAMLTMCVAYLWVNSGGSRGFLGAIMAFGLCYVLYMATVDIPMYVTRWEADQASQRPYLSLSTGLHDVMTNWKVTYSWNDWGSEISWLSLYFSLAVWASIACAHAPRFKPMPLNSDPSSGR